MCAGMMPGSGIVKSMPMVTASIGLPSGLLLVWLIGSALCLAEMAAAFPDARGIPAAALLMVGGVALR